MADYASRYIYSFENTHAIMLRVVLMRTHEANSYMDWSVLEDAMFLTCRRMRTIEIVDCLF